jgi:hypothetical protein
VREIGVYIRLCTHIHISGQKIVGERGRVDRGSAAIVEKRKAIEGVGWERGGRREEGLGATAGSSYVSFSQP